MGSTLTPAYRAHLRALWRKLAQESLAGGGETAAKAGPDLTNWASPLDAAEDRFVLYALARMALAVDRAKSAASRAARQPALTSLALLTLELLDAAEPAAPVVAPPPRLPFRADLDDRD